MKTRDRTTPTLIASLTAGTLLAATAAQAASRANAPPCAPHEVGGYIVSLYKIDAGNTKDVPLPKRSRGASDAQELGVGDVVCGGDVVYSPPQSPWAAKLVLTGGGSLTLSPGFASQIVPKPTPLALVAELLARFDQLFDSRSIDHIAAARGIGGTGGGAGEPASFKAVREWGPLIVEWRDQRRAGPRQVEIDTGASPPKMKMIEGNFIELDLAADCPERCRLTAASPTGILSYPLQIETAPESAAPRPAWLAAVGQDPARLALEGGWLLDESQQPDWRLEGRSALWSAACAYPVVLERLRLHERPLDDTELCGARHAATATSR
jgi:hypothetical protein